MQSFSEVLGSVVDDGSELVVGGGSLLCLYRLMQWCW